MYSRTYVCAHHSIIHEDIPRSQISKHSLRFNLEPMYMCVCGGGHVHVSRHIRILS